MENKIKRFLELSKEFTVDSNEVYEGFAEIKNGYLTFSGQCGLTINQGYITYTNYNENTPKQSTKIEQFEKAQLEKIAKAKRYEEYLQLQTDLLEYYTVKEKLNN